MSPKEFLLRVGRALVSGAVTRVTVPVLGVVMNVSAAETAADLPSPDILPQNWSWHVQNTDIVQATPGFPAQYSGPESLNDMGEIQHTLSFDVLAGARLWSGAEAHVDGLMWQGF